MLKGFKDFILRGNVIELSIAVVVGTAFTALVGAFTSNIVNPVIAAVGGVETDGLGFHIWPGNDKTFVNIGAVVTAFLTFLITAAVVYFIFVAPMNRINRMVKNRLGSAGQPEEAPIPADTALLAEIRDLLERLAGPEPDGGRTSAVGTAAGSAHVATGGHEDSFRHAASR
ncbi:large conductance mechanosensitive channel protein MscL [Arthrobacter sp. ov118]|jgi:large conductance mechanosensitive channel|uniref:large conductance mechanosensitive channel protein MscL n=1 Tax=Arthrobacter sp. ov118 TaxID=1761747 RepID=UPI0008E5794F|nr:large conductance mechanosensitive channel protein MscL [Arthrobacter sp. ov118]SFT87628.1 large conductance mechanosensitive channel [Arthrobacter sp. ov118]